MFTLMEDVVLKKFRSLVGFEGGDGIFCPGMEFLKCQREVYTISLQTVIDHNNFETLI